MKYLLLAIAVFLGFMRAVGHHENWLKDAAHMFLGVLLGLAIAKSNTWFNIILFVCMTILEVICAKFYGNVITLGDP